MRPEGASALGLLAALLATAGPAAARPDIRARSQQIRRQNAKDCLEDLEDILDDAPTTSLWPATACDFTSTLSGAELTSNYASFRSRMASWYSNDLDDITKLQRSCTQYISVFDQIRYCYVTGPFPATAASTTATTTSATAATTTGASTSVGSSTVSRTSAGATSTPSSTASPTPDDGGGMDPGAKAGLAIGIILAVLLTLFIAWKFFQRYRSNRMVNATAPKADEDIEPQMQAAAVGGAAGAGAAAGAAMAAAAARTKIRDPETSVYAYKSELSGDPRAMSELDPAAAVARPIGPPRNLPELDPDPPRQLSELPADSYDPTATSQPPPAYVSPPMTDSTNRNTFSTLDTAVSPLSPDSSTIQTHGLGISMGQEPAQAARESSGTPGEFPENQIDTVQHGWGRGWLRRSD